MDLIVGTAGHIDHGKTALIKALTGTDTDRLPEEKKRGITIDIGFAELDLTAHHIGFVDVPGHERFVKNMLAGASGIDTVMLIIAADEGVMPQTREHFDICRLLGVGNGIIVITKTDLVDDELLDLVRLEASELAEGSFLETAPMIAVSSKTGTGIEALKTAIADAAANVGRRRDDLVMRLAIDRSFIVKGFGTVITGTLASGTINETDELMLMPAGRKVRVRGLQNHGKSVAAANAGQRVAANLAGVDQSDVERGLVLCESGALRPVHKFDAAVEVLANAPKPLRSRQRVRVHLGTAEVLARVHVINSSGEISQGNSDLVQFRLEMPVAAIMGERFIVRSYSPQITIAGGTMLDNGPQKHRRRDTEEVRELLTSLIASEDDNVGIARIFIEASGGNGMRLADIRARTGWKLEAAANSVKNADAVVDAGGVYIGTKCFEALKKETLTRIGEHSKREPLSDGMLKKTLRDKIFAHKPQEIFRAVTASLEKEQHIIVETDLVRSASHSQKFTAEESAVLASLKEIFAKSGLEVPKLDEVLGIAASGTKISKEHARKLLQVLINGGVVIKATNDLYFGADAVEKLVKDLRAYADSTADRLIDVAKFKDIAAVSRKYAIPLLEYFDGKRVTARAGDKRLVL